MTNKRPTKAPTQAPMTVPSEIPESWEADDGELAVESPPREEEDLEDGGEVGEELAVTVGVPLESRSGADENVRPGDAVVSRSRPEAEDNASVWIPATDNGSLSA